MSVSDIPDVILHPPDEYEYIENQHGCCGLKPNLRYNGTVHRLWVQDAYRFVVEFDRGVDEYLRQFGKQEWYDDGVPAPGDNEEADEMRAAVLQAVEFYEEFEEEFEQFEKTMELIYPDDEDREF